DLCDASVKSQACKKDQIFRKFGTIMKSQEGFSSNYDQCLKFSIHTVGG
ncbi:11182_t:CDS:2, partial [Gigaspora rosea]